MSSTTVLPDGSAFSVVEMPLPKDHWLYAPREIKLGKDGFPVDPNPILDRHYQHDIAEIIRWAIRATTNYGKSDSYDPDALVPNAVYAICGSVKAQPGEGGGV